MAAKEDDGCSVDDTDSYNCSITGCSTSSAMVGGHTLYTHSRKYMASLEIRSLGITRAYRLSPSEYVMNHQLRLDANLAALNSVTTARHDCTLSQCKVKCKALRG